MSDIAPQPPPRTCSTGYCNCIAKDRHIAALEAENAALREQLAQAEREAKDFEERWLGYPKSEEASVRHLQELQRKRAAETATPAEIEEYERFLAHVRALSPRMNGLFAPAGSLSVEEIIDSLLAAASMDTLAGRYKTLKEMYVEAEARLADLQGKLDEAVFLANANQSNADGWQKAAEGAETRLAMAVEALSKAAQDAKRHRSECMYYGELEVRAEELRRKR